MEIDVQSINNVPTNPGFVTTDGACFRIADLRCTSLAMGTGSLCNDRLATSTWQARSKEHMRVNVAGIVGPSASSPWFSSTSAFALWIGAAYLVYLGVMLWRAPVSADAAPPLGAAAAFRRAYVVTALNPKGIAFFVAFVPQFMAPSAPFLPQAAILVVSFVTMASATALLWTALAGRVSSLVRRPSVRRGFNRAGGGVLVGAGVALAVKS